MRHPPMLKEAGESLVDCGTPSRGRTGDTTVKGWGLNHLSMGAFVDPARARTGLFFWLTLRGCAYKSALIYTLFLLPSTRSPLPMLFQEGGPYKVERPGICTLDGRGHPLPIRRPIGPLRYCHCILRLLLQSSLHFNRFLIALPP